MTWRSGLSAATGSSASTAMSCSSRFMASSLSGWMPFSGLLHAIHPSVSCLGDGGQSQKSKRTVGNRIGAQSYAVGFFKLYRKELTHIVAHGPDRSYGHEAGQGGGNSAQDVIVRILGGFGRRSRSSQMVQSNRDMPAVGGNAGFVSKLVGSAHCGGFQREYAPPLHLSTRRENRRCRGGVLGADDCTRSAFGGCGGPGPSR